MGKPVTIQELFNEIPASDIQLQMINNAVMAANKGSKNTPASIKIGVAEEVAMNFMAYGNKEKIGMLILIDAEVFEKARKKVLG